MKTVRMMLAVAVVVAIAIPAMAQEKKQRKGAKLSPLSQVMVRMGKLHTAVEGLDLTAEQKEKLGAVRKDLGPKMGEAFGKLKDIFTDEQQAAAEKVAKKAREAGKEGRAMMIAIEAAVKVTDEQKKKLDKVAAELQLVQREAFRKTMAVLTAQQKATVKKALAPKPRKKPEPGKKKEGK